MTPARASAWRRLGMPAAVSVLLGVAAGAVVNQAAVARPGLSAVLGAVAAVTIWTVGRRGGQCGPLRRTVAARSSALKCVAALQVSHPKSDHPARSTPARGSAGGSRSAGAVANQARRRIAAVAPPNRSGLSLFRELACEGPEGAGEFGL
jgi:hypothetical protein